MNENKPNYWTYRIYRQGFNGQPEFVASYVAETYRESLDADLASERSHLKGYLERFFGVDAAEYVRQHQLRAQAPSVAWSRTTIVPCTRVSGSTWLRHPHSGPIPQTTSMPPHMSREECAFGCKSVATRKRSNQAMQRTAIGYAKGRTAHRDGEIRVFNAAGALEQAIAFDERTDRQRV